MRPRLDTLWALTVPVLVLISGRASALAPQACTSSCPTPQACTFDGIANTALGGAVLQIDATCSLVISNIGSSGMDGVSQGPLPAGTQHVITRFGGSMFGAGTIVGDKKVATCRASVPGGILMRTRVENIGNQTIEIEHDMSPVGATLYTIIVLNGSTITDVFTDLPSAIFQTGECVETEYD